MVHTLTWIWKAWYFSKIFWYYSWFTLLTWYIIYIIHIIDLYKYNSKYLIVASVCWVINPADFHNCKNVWFTAIAIRIPYGELVVMPIMCLQDVISCIIKSEVEILTETRTQPLRMTVPFIYECSWIMNEGDDFIYSLHLLSVHASKAATFL